MRLEEINENNWIEIANLKVKEEQKNFVAPAIGILARAYAMRIDNAEAFAITVEGEIVGVLMVRDMNEEPRCYELQQFLIDSNHQGKGYGQQSLKILLEMLEKERKYNSVEVCVKKSDQSAIHVYQKVGFIDTGYVSEEMPDSLNLIYNFSN